MFVSFQVLRKVPSFPFISPSRAIRFSCETEEGFSMNYRSTVIVQEYLLSGEGVASMFIVRFPAMGFRNND